MNERRTSRLLSYRPALDGLRALAVLAVLGYHGGLLRAPGGFLGVDLFFVLSGFLITTLLLREWQSTGRIDLRAFWSRRARRLLPVLALVVTVVLLQTLNADPAALAKRRSDALAALGYFANWHLIFGHRSYFDFFSQVSPLRHTWSLGIEEQWYLGWPLLLLALLWATRRRLNAIVGFVLAAAAGSALLMAVWFVPGHDPSRVYYGTDTHLQGLLLGAALGLLFHRFPSLGDVGGRGRALVDLLGWAGLMILAAMVVMVHDSDPALYRGGFAVASLASAAAVAAATQTSGVTLTRAMSIRPLPAIGRISYGIYLWHWPLFLWLTSERLGITGWPLFGARTAVSIAVAAASYRLIEQPLRRGIALPVLRRPTLAAFGTTGLAALLVLGLARFGPTTTSANLASRSVASTAAETPRASPGTGTADVLRVSFAGDSVALTLAAGAQTYERDHHTGAVVDAQGTYLGCGIGGGRSYDGGRQVLFPSPNCDPWASRWKTTVEAAHPQVAVVLLGAWEMLDRMVDGHLLAAESPEYTQFLADRLEQGVGILSAQGARVVFLTAPCYAAARSGTNPNGGGLNRPDRNAWFNGIVERVASHHPHVVTLIDLHSWACPGGKYQAQRDGVAFRYDGVHFTLQGAQMAWEWMRPRIEALAGHPDQVRRDSQRGSPPPQTSPR